MMLRMLQDGDLDQLLRGSGLHAVAMAVFTRAHPFDRDGHYQRVRMSSDTTLYAIEDGGGVVQNHR